MKDTAFEFAASGRRYSQSSSSSAIDPEVCVLLLTVLSLLACKMYLTVKRVADASSEQSLTWTQTL